MFTFVSKSGRNCICINRMHPSVDDHSKIVRQLLRLHLVIGSSEFFKQFYFTNKMKVIIVATLALCSFVIMSAAQGQLGCGNQGAINGPNSPGFEATMGCPGLGSPGTGNAGGAGLPGQNTGQTIGACSGPGAGAGAGEGAGQGQSDIAGRDQNIGITNAPITKTQC